jgi:hypothetical protein
MFEPEECEPAVPSGWFLSREKSFSIHAEAKINTAAAIFQATGQSLRTNLFFSAGSSFSMVSQAIAGGSRSLKSLALSLTNRSNLSSIIVLNF